MQNVFHRYNLTILYIYVCLVIIITFVLNFCNILSFVLNFRNILSFVLNFRNILSFVLNFRNILSFDDCYITQLHVYQ